MTRIFVSYSHDDETIAQELVNHLRRAYDNVWYDDNLHTGDDWWGRIVGQIENCTHFIFLMSNEAYNSDYCQKELTFAREHDKEILPVKVRRSASAPEELHYLNDLQICDMFGKITVESLNELYAALIRKSGNSAPQPQLTEEHRQADFKFIEELMPFISRANIEHLLHQVFYEHHIKKSLVDNLQSFLYVYKRAGNKLFNQDLRSLFDRVVEIVNKLLSAILSTDDIYNSNSVDYARVEPIVANEVEKIISNLNRNYKELLNQIKTEYPTIEFEDYEQ